ncbi:hypothetical protein BJX70DRAFT_388665 [Aspergillus crustosus]
MSTKPKPLPTDLPIHTFPTPNSLESFLDKHHTTLPGMYIKLAKKASGIPSVTAPEAVQVALCFGWIDGRGQSIDADYWMVRYTPRRAKSLWSAKNVATITQLISGGRVRKMGLETVEAAKADGRWGRAYDGPASIEVPGDLEEALKEDERAREVFEGLNRTERYWVLHPLQTGAVSTRERRIKGVVEMLAGREVGGAKAFKVEKKSTTGKTKTKTKTGVGKEAAVKVSTRVKREPVVSTSTRQLRSQTRI